MGITDYQNGNRNRCYKHSPFISSKLQVPTVLSRMHGLQKRMECRCHGFFYGRGFVNSEIRKMEYFKQGEIEQFRQILEEGSSPEIDEYYAHVRYERIAILNALGAYYNYLGKIETKQREKEEHIILATQYYNKASRIDMHEPSTWVGKGRLLLAKGDVDQASAAFKIVLDGGQDNIPALLGQPSIDSCAIYFNEMVYMNVAPSSTLFEENEIPGRIGAVNKSNGMDDMALCAERCACGVRGCVNILRNEVGSVVDMATVKLHIIFYPKLKESTTLAEAQFAFVLQAGQR
ncbi:protein CTR9 [Artemisia annua]|uniref:Protein CTR9 n=1 Tax=Artemisia annua TaxID=35608 RepID=A0A2U1MR82_ARTAN|nr:protein CTR9 [Artemisia annua]